jgi:hypothetical protein
MTTASEKVPFRAKVKEKFEHEIVVVSLETGREYELYYHQILEALDLDEIVRMIDLTGYWSG